MSFPQVLAEIQGYSKPLDSRVSGVPPETNPKLVPMKMGIGYASGKIPEAQKNKEEEMLRIPRAREKFVLNILIMACLAILGGQAFPNNAMAVFVQVNSNGFGSGGNDPASLIGAKLGGTSYLFAATSYASGCQVLRTAGGGWPNTPFTDWTQVNTNGFSDANNDIAASMIVSGGYLFVGTHNTSTGCEIWRTAGVGGPPFTDWTQVSTDGFGDSGNIQAISMKIFKGNIYVGTVNTSGCEIWRTSNGTAWTAVVGGGAGTGNGFGDVANTQAIAMEVLNISGTDYLFVGTTNVSGCEVWYTSDGTTWTPAVGGGAAVNNGFGDAGNISAYSMHTFVNGDGYLYVGTTNLSGCEVWRTSNGTAWTAVVGGGAAVGNGFNNSNNWSADAMEVFQPVPPNTYYVIQIGTSNSTTGAELWMSSNGTSWTSKMTGGFGNSKNSQISAIYCPDPPGTITNNGSSIFNAVMRSDANGGGIWTSKDDSDQQKTLITLSSFTATGNADGVTLKWVTESEVENAGFNLLRAESEDGTYVQINPSLIPAEGNETAGHAYTYADTSASIGGTYYYKLEDIDLKGVSTLHGPVEVEWGCFILTAPKNASKVSLGKQPGFAWESGTCTPEAIEFSPNKDLSKKMSYTLTANAQKWQPRPREWAFIQYMGRKGRTVYWRVSGRDTAGNTVYSPVYGFTLEMGLQKR